MSNVTGDPRPPLAYALGHTESELERLSIQAQLIDPITESFFRKAGVASGMRVLDVGSGVGDVAFLVAELVGEAGQVVGIDRASSALAIAQTRAQARSLRNLSFREGELNEMTFEQPFDAIVGRYVLQFLPDPAAALRKLATHLRPGGVIVFHELDWNGAHSWPPAPTYDQCCRWVAQAIRALGAQTSMGVKLHSTFVAAGLPAPSMHLEAVIGGGVEASERLHLVSDLVVTLLPAMEQFGIATAQDVNIETLAARMQSEVDTNGSTIVGRSEIGAWSRLSQP